MMLHRHMPSLTTTTKKQQKWHYKTTSECSNKIFAMQLNVVVLVSSALSLFVCWWRLQATMSTIYINVFL